jgi:hypothetical protein
MKFAAKLDKLLQAVRLRASQENSSAKKSVVSSHAKVLLIIMNSYLPLSIVEEIKTIFEEEEKEFEKRCFNCEYKEIVGGISG